MSAGEVWLMVERKRLPVRVQRVQEGMSGVYVESVKFKLFNPGEEAPVEFHGAPFTKRKED